jgi:hypothetical protein
MTWRRPTNYHGSREYGTDLPGFSIVDRINLTVAWLLSRTKRMFRRLLGSGSYPSATAALLLQESKRQLARHEAARNRIPAAGDRTFVDGSDQFPQLGSLRAEPGPHAVNGRKLPFGE